MDFLPPSFPGEPTTEKGLLDPMVEEKRPSLLPSPQSTLEGLGPAVAPAAARRLVIGVAVLFVLLAVPYVIPSLTSLRPWVAERDAVPFWNVVGRELLGEGRALQAEQEALALLTQRALGGAPSAPSEVTPEAREEPAGSAGVAAASAPVPDVAVFPPYPGHPEDTAAAPVEIEFRERLSTFYRKLTLVDLKQPRAIARAGHWGDSVLANDGITSALRRRLQARFGDAGHGFHALARYNLGYHHQGVRFFERGSWSKCEIIFKCEKDAHYGYAGVSVSSSGGGTGYWETSKKGIGQKVSRFELWYAKRPNGGRFQIKVDGEVERVVDTKADELGDGWELIVLPEDPHSFEVRAIGYGVSRGYGVTLETEGPGIVWDGLALIGSFTQRLDYQDQEHINRQIAHRDNDLLVFLLGGNDVQRDKMDLYRSLAPYEEEYTQVIRKFRQGKPQASCLIMSVTDHGERVSPGVMRTIRVVPKMVLAQRKVAEAEGCAFYNTFQAMGGEGSVVRWYRANPPLAGPDLAHPTTFGHELLASLFHGALMRGYAEYRTSMTGKPLPELSQP